MFCHAKLAESILDWKFTLANDAYAKLALALFEQRYVKDHNKATDALATLQDDSEEGSID